MTFAAHLDNVFVKTPRFGGIGNQLREAIAAVDVGHHGNRADAVCGVEVAIAGDSVLGAPLRFGKSLFSKLGAVAIGTFAVVEFHFAQIMLVAALQVDELAKDVLTNHIQYGHDITPVTIILQHHERHAGFSDVRTISQHSSTVMPVITSHPTYFFAFMASMHMTLCHSHGVA